MSVKVPAETVEYQSHNHCQCDFCSSRRSVNAKKLSVSQRAAQLQHAASQNGCCCRCHDAVNASTFAASRNGNTTFDPEHPAPVNQTALNASRGRTGAPNGKTGSTGAAQGNSAAGKSKEEEEKDAMEELDRLERLLILEHKARINATLEADRVATLRDGKAATTGLRGPQPLPAGYSTNGNQQPPFNGSGSNYRGGDSLLDGANAETIREAYELAHQCPVTPPVQCRSSHRLQDTMNDVRAVTMDPINPAGRVALQQVLYDNGMSATPPASASANKQQLYGSGKGDGTMMEKEFGSSLAKNRTSHAHPQGAGVVWVNSQKQSGLDATTNKADGSTMVASQYQQADGSRAGAKSVTYAL